jgi:D-3-phosphoglycerate dehydrogenase / 2-oxoglutarate reductase
MPKVLITTVPFGKHDSTPLKLLENAGIEYLINPLNRKLTEKELSELVTNFDVIIAGTEPITKKVMVKASYLKHISRVGIGLDSVDLIAAESHGIKVSYTADAPAPAVTELTLGLIISLLRNIHISNHKMHQGEWYRYLGRRLSEVTVGIIGVGRIGSRVLQNLQHLGTAKILANDIEQNLNHLIEWVEKEQIYKEADIISLHLPLTFKTKNMITEEHLLMMKTDAILINTSRGGIINENDLYKVMQSGHLSGAAIDVFNKEPYDGLLKEVDRCLLTAHMGSMSKDCRARMEIEATEEAIRFLNGKSLEGAVPVEEYSIRREGL